MSGGFAFLAVISTIVRLMVYVMCIATLPVLHRKLGEYEGQFRIWGGMAISHHCSRDQYLADDACFDEVLDHDGCIPDFRRCALLSNPAPCGFEVLELAVHQQDDY